MSNEFRNVLDILIVHTVHNYECAISAAQSGWSCKCGLQPAIDDARALLSAPAPQRPLKADCYACGDEKMVENGRFVSHSEATGITCLGSGKPAPAPQPRAPLFLTIAILREGRVIKAAWGCHVLPDADAANAAFLVDVKVAHPRAEVALTQTDAFPAEYLSAPAPVAPLEPGDVETLKSLLSEMGGWAGETHAEAIRTGDKKIRDDADWHDKAIAALTRLLRAHLGAREGK